MILTQDDFFPAMEGVIDRAMDTFGTVGVGLCEAVERHGRTDIFEFALVQYERRSSPEEVQRVIDAIVGWNNASATDYKEPDQIKTSELDEEDLEKTKGQSLYFVEEVARLTEFGDAPRWVELTLRVLENAKVTYSDVDALEHSSQLQARMIAHGVDADTVEYQTAAKELSNYRYMTAPNGTKFYLLDYDHAMFTAHYRMSETVSELSMFRPTPGLLSRKFVFNPDSWTRDYHIEKVDRYPTTRTQLHANMASANELVEWANRAFETYTAHQVVEVDDQPPEIDIRPPTIEDDASDDSPFVF